MDVDQALQACQEAIGYRFNNLELLKAAITHASIAPCRQASNERLEFLGDSALGMAVCMEVFRRYPDFCEGELTKIKSAVVSRKTCASISKKISLDKHLLLGKGVGEKESIPSSMMAAVLESVIGAILLDSSFEAAQAFILRHIGPYIDAAVASKHQLNYKSQLQQHSQKMLGQSPTYEIVEEQGPDHSKCFEVCVRIADRTFRSAWGRNKKDAEQQAAFHALVALGLLNEEEEFSRQVMVSDPFLQLESSSSDEVEAINNHSKCSGNGSCEQPVHA